MIGKVSTFLGPNGLFQGVSGTPSLVLSLDASNVLSYPGTGITWSDLTIFNNDVIFTTVHVGENPTYSISGGGSFEFGDVDDSFVLSTTSSGFPLGDSQYTIETWINPDNLSQTAALVIYGALGENSANSIGLSNSSIIVDWNDNILSSPIQSMIPGNWYYLSSTYNGTDRKIYLNGSLIASDTPGVTNSVTTGDTLTIGNFMGQPFTGKISIVKLHTKALSSSRLLSNFNSLKTRFGYVFGSMTFNDTDSYLISTSNDYVLGTNDFTVEAFFKASTASNPYTGIVSQRQVGNNNISINLQSANTSEPLIEFSSAGTGLSTYTASNDEWYHVSISRTGGTSSYFINGNLVNEVADTTDYTISDLVVGRYYTSYSNYYFNGIISNVRVINGTGLYTGTFSVPEVQLSATYSNTKFLINSQQTTPTADVSGLLHSVTASSVGWTSSLPYFYEFYYPNFSDTTGLALVNTIGVVGNAIKLTDTSNSYSGNVYRTNAIKFDRSFSLEWSFECSGGDGADGFCVQWTTTNNTNGGDGGDVGMILDSSTINAFRFQTHTNNSINWYHSNTSQSSQNLSINIRQNVYYWVDYNYATSTLYISYATTNTKPGSSQHTFTGVTFDSTSYYIGFGAATGGSTDNHILKSMKLTF